MKLPSLHAVADRASGRQQSMYFSLVLTEYAALVSVAVLNVYMLPDRRYVTFYGVLLALALTTLVIRSVIKPEERWYQARALAESVKTTAWKYAMVARPFMKDDQDGQRLRQMLQELLTANQMVGSQFNETRSDGDQITPDMHRLRVLPTSERLGVYMRNRVEDQLDWYRRKSEENTKLGRDFAIFLGVLYVLAFAVLLIRLNRPDWIYAHPDPLILLAASVLGWMQIKRFNELGTSYALTAIEIGILKTRAPEIADDTALSLFIDDAEEAFSREHTQWLARRSALGNRNA